MPLTLGPGTTGDKLAAKQNVGTDVICEINGDLRTISGSTDAYGSLFQGALGTSPAALVGPSAGTDMIIDSITLSNPGASTRIVTLYKTRNSTTYDATTQWASITLLPGEFATWSSTGWQIYTAQGVVKSALVSGGLMVVNASVAAQAGFATDTYLAGSGLLLPTGLIRAGSSMYWGFDAVKTAAGTAAPTVSIRFGTAGAIGDTARITFTFSAQTAVVDRAIFEVWANFRSVGSGSAAVLAGIARLHHQLAVTGFNTVQPAGLQTLDVTSGGFDSTPAASYAGLSVNGGASAAWTVTVVQAQAYM
ncbi:MAG TPA: hypothetical protein VLL97_06085 [Acidobacteriota bacterium]|nr:hypothetical protein [Acidobacteriota bacterium]